ncbi:hypothetical protein GCM10025867_22390 [Frondihabitans sucicola]|uniref:LPXTG cell wall anchor domain-containing protein n=1 Tax=Frondihabitans sucicola TaxID=1268041 RepID=A0ABN6Y1Y0_9MICO|nr:hypothetical protein GCM10025867_22390 [Frondihabitans sucicola]
MHENPAPAPGAGSQWSPPVISPESFVAYQADPVTVTVRNIIVPSGAVDPGGVGPGGGGPVDPGGIAPAVTPPQLAFTGSAPTPLGLAGLAALLAGWLVVFASRRRRRAT